jgi:putative N6-adenine-specific DNA methylase
VSAPGGGRGSSALRLVATCTPGLEPILERELSSLGMDDVEPARSAIRFRGDWPAAWRANYWLRTANRVLVEIASFPAGTSEELYAGASKLLASTEGSSPAGGRSPSLASAALSELLSPARTFAVSATSSGSRLRDTRWIALKVKDAIADAQRARFRRRADVDPRRPDVPLRVWLNDDRATVLLDSSREPLDRRGYREISGMAPLREPLAAAMVLATGWDGTGPVVDPMCGTGTLLIEAAWIALGRAPGALRQSWVFERWPGFDARAWARVRDQRPNGAPRHDAPTLRLHGRDLSSDAIRAARRNVEAAGLTHLVDLATADGFAFAPPPGPGLVLANPAYGERLETSDQEWRRIGDLLKQRYAGWRCALIAGEPGFGKQVGLKPRRRIPVKNGPLDARILLFDLYAGSARKPTG